MFPTLGGQRNIVPWLGSWPFSGFQGNGTRQLALEGAFTWLRRLFAMACLLQDFTLVPKWLAMCFMPKYFVLSFRMSVFAVSELRSC